MTSSIRTTLSAATALGLVSFIATSALVSGLFATPTVAAFGFLAAWGTLEIAMLSYAAPYARAPRAMIMPAAPVREIRRVPALVEFPVAARACRPLAA